MENDKKLSGGKVFLISLLTSIVVSVIITIALFNMGIPNLSNLLNKSIEVDDVRNAKLEHAKLILERKGLLISVSGEEESADVPKGSIIKQEPLPGSIVKKGATINVITSKGIESIELPNLNMLPVEDAKAKITNLGLVVGQIKSSASDTVQEGYVISSDPQPATKLEKGKTVSLLISGGKKKVRVPSLWNLDINEVAIALQKKGLKLGTVKKTTDIKKKFDIILGQSPDAGAVVPEGTEVTVTVNAEEEEGAE